MAAGLGFKTFTTGEVLTAADTNGYLMQGVLVFASAAARDAAITSPQEGQCCYLKDTDAVLTYSGTAWVGFDDSNAIQNSIVDAKGDLVAASGADTPARLAVGSNGETLVADSSTSTGLRYQAPVNVNPVLNSSFQVWQRGTSGSGNSTGTSGYNADRWQNYLAGTITVSRQATNDSTNLPFIQYCARVQRNSGTTSTGIFYNNQNIETLNSVAYAGKTVTISFYARAGANYSSASNALTANVISGTGTDQNLFGGFTGAANTVNGTATLTTTWQRFSYTGTLGSTTSELCVTFQYTPTGTAGANDYYEITGIQLEVGSVATPFKTYAGTIQGELAACQRYYQRYTVGVNQNTGFTTLNYSTTAAVATLPMKVTMRVAPTVLDYSNILIYDSVNAFTITGLALWAAGTTDTSGLLATGASGMTQFRGGILTANASGGYIGLSAEL
jgi:hypothetical protein